MSTIYSKARSLSQDAVERTEFKLEEWRANPFNFRNLNKGKLFTAIYVLLISCLFLYVAPVEEGMEKVLTISNKILFLISCLMLATNVALCFVIKVQNKRSLIAFHKDFDSYGYNIESLIVTLKDLSAIESDEELAITLAVLNIFINKDGTRTSMDEDALRLKYLRDYAILHFGRMDDDKLSALHKATSKALDECSTEPVYNVDSQGFLRG